MKHLRSIVGILVFASVAFGLYRIINFAYQNLRGAKTAFGPVVKPTTSNSPSSITSDTTGLGLTVPIGFHIAFFAKDVPNARVLALDPSGTLLVSEPSQGKIVALIDADNDGVSEKKVTVVEGLNLPHGLAFKDGEIYIAETDKVSRFAYDQTTHTASNKRKLFDLSGNGNHFSRTIGFGPDDKLYVSIGSTCNVCVEKNPMRASIYSANADGSNFVPFAIGLRNSPFFVWHPVTHDMWATEMGRDLLGDDTPPDEINIVKSPSTGSGLAFYGWPYCYGKNIRDTSFSLTGLDPVSKSGIVGKDICDRSVPSHIDLQAHSAPLGLAFIPTREVVNKYAIAQKLTTSGLWPIEYEGDLLVSFHGSWNRSEPTGYKIVRIKLDKNGAYEGTEDFLLGFIEKNGTKGRPVDLLFDQNGILFISDDKAGVIYRLSFQPD